MRPILLALVFAVLLEAPAWAQLAEPDPFAGPVVAVRTDLTTGPGIASTDRAAATGPWNYAEATFRCQKKNIFGSSLYGNSVRWRWTWWLPPSINAGKIRSSTNEPVKPYGMSAGWAYDRHWYGDFFGGAGYEYVDKAVISHFTLAAGPTTINAYMTNDALMFPGALSKNNPQGFCRSSA